MSTAIEEILDSFNHLSEAEKRTVTSEIIRRTLALNLPPLSDDELIANAEAVFRELDQREAGND